MYVNEMGPEEEVQHIMEVLQRGNPVKGISIKGGIIQVEQTKMKDLEKVLQGLVERGYEILSIEQLLPSGWAVGIRLKEREKEKNGFEPGD